MKKLKLLLVIILFCFTSCGGKDVYVDCVVVSKYIKPPYTTLFPIYNGKTTILVPRTNPQEYIVVVDNDMFDKQQEKYVDSDTYNKTNVGDTVSIKIKLYFK